MLRSSYVLLLAIAASGKNRKRNRMLDSSFVAWCYYLLGATGLFVFWWRLTRDITMAKLQRSLRAAAAALLVCPFSIGDGYADMAPAILMVAMETVFEGTDSFFRGGPTLLGSAALAIVAALLWDEYLVRRNRQDMVQAQLDHDRDELLAQSE